MWFKYIRCREKIATHLQGSEIAGAPASFLTEPRKQQALFFCKRVFGATASFFLSFFFFSKSPTIFGRRDARSIGVLFVVNEIYKHCTTVKG